MEEPFHASGDIDLCSCRGAAAAGEQPGTDRTEHVAFGLGEGVVSGRVAVDRWIVDASGAIVRRTIASKPHAVVIDPEGGTMQVASAPGESATPCLDDALVGLSEVDPELGELVELRFFGGLTIEEMAVVRGVSAGTIKRSWKTAQSWLRREMNRS